jgi:wobble nucleotide-excising tRNase
LREERDALTKKIEQWNDALNGKAPIGGKRKELVDLDNQFKDTCWAQKIKHDANFQNAFEGVRASSEKFKNKLLENVATASPLKSLDELTKKASTIFGHSPALEQSISAIQVNDVVAHESNPILQKRVIGKEDVDISAMIEKLGNSDWVKEGKGFYDKNDKCCPFCQRATDDAFAKSLNEYFDESFVNDTESIDALATDYQTDTETLLARLNSTVATPSRFLNVERFKELIELLRTKITVNKQKILAKQKESSQLVSLDSLGAALVEVSTLISNANTLIADHNKMVSNLSTEKQALTSQIWKFVVEEIKADITAYQTKRGNIKKAVDGLEKQITDTTEAIAEKQNQIRELERQTTSVQPAVDAINEILISFGFNNFSIVQAENGTSYKLVRPDGTAAMETLSEGEKTFVTFLYFFQLISGSATDTGITNNRVVVFDDPVSSLDSDILFIVGSLIKGVFDDVRTNKGYVKQVFVLTHNVYFHKEVTFKKGRGKKRKASDDETFWTVRKSNSISKFESHSTNPIKTSYELLWAELRRTDGSNLTIQNTLRRILENYFKILGEVDLDDICDKFSGREKVVCKSLFSWVNDGSHFAYDDLFVADGTSIDSYLDVFKKVFIHLGHDGHYRMMMREDKLEEPHII